MVLEREEIEKGRGREKEGKKGEGGREKSRENVYHHGQISSNTHYQVWLLTLSLSILTPLAP